ALVRTVEGVVEVDIESESLLGEADAAVDHERTQLQLPRLVASSAAGSTVVALVDRRPPLLVSGDGGATWREAGGGLPAGFDVAVDPNDPDRVLYAGRNRLYLSTDGGRFWRALQPELPDVEAVAWSQ
ncbi:MAG: Sortilin, neurotensin receptor 3, partial [Gaiellaceae bacterium]|nr:Sortilin, neurotensin receptor 3 [Gaiellaceae bacterium]